MKKLVRNNKESGQMFVLVLILLALVPLLVIPWARINYTSQKYHQTIEANTLNVYAADSGVEWGRYQIYNFPSEIQAEPLSANLTINGIKTQVNVEFDTINAAYNIVSQSTKADRNVTIHCTIVIDVGLFGNVVACDGNLNIAQTDFENPAYPGESNVFTNGDIDIDQSFIDGDIRATGSIDIDKKSTYSGELEEGVDAKPFPDIDAQIHEDRAKEGGTYNGDLVLDGGYEELGPLYIDGKLDIKGDCSLNITGTVYATGDLNIDHTEITGFGDLLCEGKFTAHHYDMHLDNTLILPLWVSVNDNVEINADNVHENGENTTAILYAPNGVISMNHVTLIGSVAAPEVTIDQAYMYYPAELRGRADLPGAGLDTVTYIFD